MLTHAKKHCAHELVISSVLNECTTSDSAASIVIDENQSLAMNVPSLFFITRTRLRARSAELPVTASDARIRYRPTD